MPSRNSDGGIRLNAGSNLRYSHESVLSNGIPAHQLLSLKPGTYTLRVGVIDRASQQVGTLSVPFVME